MGGHSQFRVLQVSNISPSATKDEIYTLFSYIGRIDECRLYPSNSSTTTAQTKPKFAFIKFEKEKSVELGQHLTNVVFVDRALICVPALSNNIPDEETALHEGIPAPPGQRQLPADIKNEEKDYGDGLIMIETIDPQLTALGLPAYPPLPTATDPSKIEEIRRTIYIGNLPKDCDGDNLMEFINTMMGEVMYLRMAPGNDRQQCDYAYVEFSNIRFVAQALQNNGIDYEGHPLRIQHSRVAIIKPQRKTADQALEEVEEAIKINEGKSTLTRANASVSPHRRRSPSPRKRSKDRDERRRSRSPRRRRSRSKKRSKSKERRRSRSRDRERRRSKDRRSKSRDRRSSSRDRDRRSKRSRSRDRKRGKEKERERERVKEKEKEKERRERDRKKRSRSRSPKKNKKDKEKDKDRKKSRKHESEEPAKKKEKTLLKPISSSSSEDGDESLELKKKRDDSPSSSEKTKIESSPHEEKSTEKEIKHRSTKKATEAEDNDLEFEEEVLRERLLERVKRKRNTSEDGEGTESLLANFKPEPMDVDEK